MEEMEGTHEGGLMREGETWREGACLEEVDVGVVELAQCGAFPPQQQLVDVVHHDVHFIQHESV